MCDVVDELDDVDLLMTSVCGNGHPYVEDGDGCPVCEMEAEEPIHLCFLCDKSWKPGHTCKKGDRDGNQ